MLGAILVFGELVSGIFTILVVLVGVLTELDPFHFLLEEFLPHPYYRTNSTIVASWIVRFFLAALCGCEFMRWALFVSYSLVVLAITGISLLNCLLKFVGNYCIFSYIELRIILGSVLNIVGKMMGVVTPLAHLITICFLWMGLQSWNQIPNILSIFFIFTGIFGTISASMILVGAGKAQIMAQKLINKHKNKNFSTRKSRVGSQYYYYCLWSSQIPMGLPCGSFFMIEKSFAMAYLRELANNLTNALLLIMM